MNATNDEADQIRTAFRLATARYPTNKELDIISKRLQLLKVEYEKDTKEVAKILNVGEAPIDEHLDPTQLAAFTGIASLILNLDEVITKQ
jgi:hypothetical protein